MKEDLILDAAIPSFVAMLVFQKLCATPHSTALQLK
jgi:hypothetical protein